MNWTGGSLQRTKNANKGMVQRQKAHFARARTQLQQSPGAQLMLFRPEYLCDSDDGELRHHLHSFRDGSPGHPARKHRETDERDASPTAHRSRHLQANPHFSLGKRDSGTARAKKREREGRATDIDTEMQLLEANKKRLLRQQDWIGVAPSRPVGLQFLSVREKSRIGKRRKIDEKSKLVARRRSPTTLPHPTGQNEFEGHGGAFRSGALRILSAANNIRVRIGSHALTVASTQPKDYAESQSNSDSMLLDEESKEVTRRLESEAQQSITASGHVLGANPRSVNDQPAKPYEGHSPQHGQYTHQGLTASLNGDAGGHIWTSTLNHSIQATEATGPSYHITHHVGSVERPLKLVFGKQSPSRATRVASPTDQTGETQRAHADFDAEKLESRRASQNVSEAYRSTFARPAIQSAIIDDEPWRMYLGIGQSSSDHVCVDDGTGTSVPQPYIPARNTGADRTSWPQHTTQSNLTRANLWTVSASLPAPKWLSERLPDARPHLRAAVVKDIDEHEKLWRSFALGSDPESATDTIHTHNDTSEDLMSRATKGYASTRLLLSTAVTSVSSLLFQSPPFRLVSGRASRISDDVQYAPRSGSRSITPAAPPYTTWGRMGSRDENNVLDYNDVQDEGQGQEMAARSRSGEQSVHASLQNYASSDSSSDMFGDTRTSCSDLDQLNRARDDVSRRAQAIESAPRQRGRGSSIGDMPGSDDAGIDLVDVDRM